MSKLEQSSLLRIRELRFAAVLFELLLKFPNSSEGVVPACFELTGDKTIVGIDCVVLPLTTTNFVATFSNASSTDWRFMVCANADCSATESEAAMLSGCGGWNTYSTTARSIVTPPSDIHAPLPRLVRRPLHA